MRHVVWDWNGTLLDDLEVVVESVNEAIAPYGARVIDADGYRDHYQRPVRGFYDVLLERPVSDDEWIEIDGFFHERYRGHLGRVGLTGDAVAALEAVRASGASQSLLSMWWHDELLHAVDRHGLAGYFEVIDGNRRHAGETKAEHLAHHIERLGLDSGDIVAIGDSIDDAAAARSAGVVCVMYDGGSHHRHQLEQSGFPVAVSLLEAVDLALR